MYMIGKIYCFEWLFVWINFKKDVLLLYKSIIYYDFLLKFFIFIIFYFMF